MSDMFSGRKIPQKSSCFAPDCIWHAYTALSRFLTGFRGASRRGEVGRPGTRVKEKRRAKKEEEWRPPSLGITS